MHCNSEVILAIYLTTTGTTKKILVLSDNLALAAGILMKTPFQKLEKRQMSMLARTGPVNIGGGGYVCVCGSCCSCCPGCPCPCWPARAGPVNIGERRICVSYMWVIVGDQTLSIYSRTRASNTSDNQSVFVLTQFEIETKPQLGGENIKCL